MTNNEFIDLKNNLREILPLDSGGSFKLLWDMIYHIRLVKYIRQSQIKSIDKRYSKICATKKLLFLSKLNLLSNTYQDVFIATDYSLEVLKFSGLPVKLLPATVSGEGNVNELNNTEVFIQALKLPDFLSLLYPVFNEYDKPYLKPDALLIRGTKEKYKLEFLEIEASKSNWNDWIENKRVNYLKLAQDIQVYSYWKAFCTYLDLKPPPVENFKFSVTFVGQINKDFGTGFIFKENINVK